LNKTDKKIEKSSTKLYVSTDLAVIIPTKDRPREVSRLLQSISELNCKVGRIIVIASGQDIRDQVMFFMDRIPVEYCSSEPGQIKQRNKGISLLDDSTKLVATMDDDAVFHKDAVSEMIQFWNSIPSETAGVGFNIVNQPANRHTWLRGLCGVSVPEAGKVLKSGVCTPIKNIDHNIRTEWLNGGATVWSQEILRNYEHNEINSKWAVFEDLIFSYPIGKKYPIYVCKSSNVKIDESFYNKDDIFTSIYKGKTLFIWGYYFVSLNSNLSIRQYLFYHFFHIILKIIRTRNKEVLFEGIGALYGSILVLKGLLFNDSDTIALIEKYT